jgi:hypothetical protein
MRTVSFNGCRLERVVRGERSAGWWTAAPIWCSRSAWASPEAKGVAAWGWGRESRDVVLGREIFLLGAAGDRSISFLLLFIYFLNNSNLLNCSLFYPRHVSREPQFGKTFRTCSS